MNPEEFKQDKEADVKLTMETEEARQEALLKNKAPNNPPKIEYNLTFLTDQDLKNMGIGSVWGLLHCAPNEGGRNMGVRGRKGVGGIQMYTEVIKMDDGTYKRRDRFDIAGKTPEELGYKG